MFTSIFSSLTFNAWASGAVTGLGLFAVVGAQSAFILRQGLMRAHILSVLLICALIDATFIFSSVLGLQALTTWAPWLTQFVLVFGVAFLAWYAWQAARRALNNNSGLAAARDVVPSRKAAMLGALGFSLLNPHFWLDIMVVGSLASGFGDSYIAYAFGALTASVMWLAILGLGSHLFAPFFSSPRAWRILDGVIAIVISILAITLAVKGI